VQFSSAPEFTDELTFKYFILFNGGRCQADSANKIIKAFLLTFLLLIYVYFSPFLCRLIVSLFLEVFVLNKDEIPFDSLCWDRYEQIKSLAAR
jgi:hypothetical protein